jgi:hypothetical protein
MKKKYDYKVVGISMTTENLEKIDQEAQEFGVTRTALVNAIIENYYIYRDIVVEISEENLKNAENEAKELGFLTRNELINVIIKNHYNENTGKEVN